MKNIRLSTINKNKTLQISFLLVSLFALCIYVPKLPAQQNEVVDSNEVLDANTKTVFIDAEFGRKRTGSTKQMNKMHIKMARKGYTIIDVEPWVENGDLEGFFLTYVKDN